MPRGPVLFEAGLKQHRRRQVASAARFLTDTFSASVRSCHCLLLVTSVLLTGNALFHFQVLLVGADDFTLLGKPLLG